MDWAVPLIKYTGAIPKMEKGGSQINSRKDNEIDNSSA